VRLTCSTSDGNHHVTIPLHAELRTGTLSSILANVAEQLGITRDELVVRLFG
jgi:hypothetical protein